LRMLFVALCTLSAVIFLAIVFIIITYKVDRNERW
jgi:autotransporter translocation and assembly factor TamB